MARSKPCCMKPARCGGWLLQQLACPDYTQPCPHRGLHCPAESHTRVCWRSDSPGLDSELKPEAAGPGLCFPQAVRSHLQLCWPSKSSGLAQDIQETTTSFRVLSPLLMTPPEPAQPSPREALAALTHLGDWRIRLFCFPPKELTQPNLCTSFLRCSISDSNLKGLESQPQRRTWEGAGRQGSRV